MGSVELGTRLKLGREKQVVVTAEQYRALLARFAGKSGVEVGLSRRPPRGSLGSWLRANVGGDVLVAYVGPILVREGYAEREGEGTVRFAPAPGGGFP